MYKNLLKFLLPFFFVSCTMITSSTSLHRTNTLAKLLQTLDLKVSYEESLRLSNDVFVEVNRLTQKFQPFFEPHINNFFINIGIKDKGLCYQWSDELYRYFSHKKYKYFTFHILVANKGDYFFEHNVLVITSKKGRIMDGIIIDPWRDSKNLYISTVKNDNAYKWSWRQKREKYLKR